MGRETECEAKQKDLEGVGLMIQRQSLDAKTAVAVGAETDAGRICEVNQPSVMIQVLKGDHGATRDDNFLCEFNIDEIPSAPHGAPQIEATFDIDTRDSLNVPAENKYTGRSRQITIANLNGHPSQIETDHVIQEQM